MHNSPGERQGSKDAARACARRAAKGLKGLRGPRADAGKTPGTPRWAHNNPPFADGLWKVQAASPPARWSSVRVALPGFRTSQGGRGLAKRSSSAGHRLAVGTRYLCYPTDSPFGATAALIRSAWYLPGGPVFSPVAEDLPCTTTYGGDHTGKHEVAISLYWVLRIGFSPAAPPSASNRDRRTAGSPSWAASPAGLSPYGLSRRPLPRQRWADTDRRLKRRLPRAHVERSSGGAPI